MNPYSLAAVSAVTVHASLCACDVLCSLLHLVCLAFTDVFPRLLILCGFNAVSGTMA